MSGPDSPDDRPGEEARREAGLERAVGNAAFVLALRERGVRDTAVLRAMELVPRARFAPAAHRDLARRDIALPLACGATMTAPTTIAAMLVALALRPGARVLEIGTGSGYVAALMARIGAAEVVTIERYATLAEDADDALRDDPAVRVVLGDGLAPQAQGERGFDRILVSGSVAALPEHWTGALNPGGRLVASLAGPAGGRLLAVERRPEGLSETLGASLRLAPLVPGRAAML